MLPSKQKCCRASSVLQPNLRSSKQCAPQPNLARGLLDFFCQPSAARNRPKGITACPFFSGGRGLAGRPSGDWHEGAHEGRRVGYLLKRQPLASYLATRRPCRGPRTRCSPLQEVADRDALSY